MAGSISGLDVGGAAVCAVLVWSGFKGTSLADTFKALLKGNLNAPVTQGISTAALTSASGSGGSGNTAANNLAIAQDAEQYKGQGYTYGGPSSPGKWDCSSFAGYVLGHDLGYQIPGGSWATVTSNGTTHGGDTAATYKSWSGATDVTGATQPGMLCCWDTHVGFIAVDGTSLISAYDTAKGTLIIPNYKTAGPAGEMLTVRQVNAAVSVGTASVTAGSSNQNLNTIGLTLHKNYGYSQAAAAGIAGCVAGESGGDPESQGSGGRGLIGWTPPSKLPDSAFTGNASADLSAQIGEIDKYNKSNWSQYIPMLNAQADPVAAADFYSQYFERPASALSDVRSGVATSVYAYIGSH